MKTSQTTEATARQLNATELIEAYVASCNDGPIGVNYWLAQEVERRGLQDDVRQALLVEKFENHEGTIRSQPELPRSR